VTKDKKLVIVEYVESTQNEDIQKKIDKAFDVLLEEVIKKDVGPQHCFLTQKVYHLTYNINLTQKP